MGNCSFCGREINNKGSLKAHEQSCKLNPNAIRHKRGPDAGQKKGSTPWNKGLTKDDPRVAAGAKAFSEAYNEGKFDLGHLHTEETKARMSQIKRNLYESGWEPTCGRCKKYDHESPIAGEIKVDGTWELMVARYLDSLGVIWERNRKRFKYVKPDGKEATYQPDFYVKDWDTYIEVKGYETALDRCKWEQFPLKLEVWKRDKVFNL